MRSIFELPHLGADPEQPFPAPASALDSPNGLLAWGGDLRPARLLQAYSQGIFPWYTEGQPILWWSPAPRCVLFPDEVHLSRRTRRRYNSGNYHLSVNRDFEAVITACADIRSEEQGSWITLEMKVAYLHLHQLGHAHSLEVWNDNTLAGGIYGLALGHVFFGESMFSSQTDGSKIALVALCRLLQEQGFSLLDCQVGNPHLYSMGARDISREAFQVMLTSDTGAGETSCDWKSRTLAQHRW